MNSERIRYLVLNCKEPLLFTNFNDWDVIKWDLRTWIETLKDEELQFRRGTFKHTKEPQWENKCEKVKGTLKEFLDFENTNKSSWLYFDYKYLRDWFKNIPQIQKNISWHSFGFPEFKSIDGTIWIGSKGAHTPCHMDTYGCNLVTQIYGRKKWLLFSPETNLLPTRIPYEESSIYSQINFFSPNRQKCKGLSKGRTVVLNPGDTLFVPPGWWHYVENLENAISINIWIPMPNDYEKRLDESIVQLLVTQLGKELSPDEKNDIFNSFEDIEAAPDLKSSLQVIEACSSAYNAENNSKKLKSSPEDCKPIEDYDVNEIIEANSDIIKVPVLSEQELKTFLDNQSARFEQTVDENEALCTVKKIFDAVLHPDVIALIKSKLIRSTTS